MQEAAMINAVNVKFRALNASGESRIKVSPW